MSGEHHEAHCFSADSEAVARRGLALMFDGPSGWFSSMTEEPILSINSEPPSRKQVKCYDNREPRVLIPRAAKAETLASRMPSGCGFSIAAGNPWPHGTRLA